MMSVSWVAFLLALTGILYEYTLAQYVLAILGGGYNILFFIFCIFAFFLGFGSFLVSKFESLKYSLLVKIQIFLGLLGIVLPKYYQAVQNLGSSYYYLSLALCLLPVALIGLLTGYEIPLLYKLSKVKIEKILTFDYIGMSLGILLFPFLALKWLQISSLTYALSALSIITAIIINIFLKNKNSELMIQESNNENPNVKLSTTELTTLGFIFSFCSFAYQGLIGKTINATLSDHYLVNYYSIGLFIIGLALGAYKIDRKVNKIKNPGDLLFYNEIKLISLISLVPIIIFGCLGIFFLLEGPLFQISEKQYLFFGLGLLSILPFSVGYLTGFELPLIIHWSGQPSGHRVTLYIITANYIAALFAGVIIGFIAGHYIGTTFTYLPVIAINLLACFYVMLKSTGLNAKTFGLFLIPLFFVCLNAFFNLPARQFFLDSYYSKVATSNFEIKSFINTLKLLKQSGLTWRYESYFQNIDFKIIQNSTVEGQSDSFSLFLNKQPQLSSLNVESYHLSMVYAAQMLKTESIKNILILGGGDGILARYCLENFPDIPITLVELDPTMIQLAKNNTHLTELNKYSLENKNVNVIIGDAYQFIKTTDLNYQLVLIDFPYPTNLDISRLYSFEFYKSLNKVLSPQGLAIIDAPILINFDDQKTQSTQIVNYLLSTLIKSGFINAFPFGPYDPFFVVTKDNRNLKFNNWDAKIPNSVFLNLHSLEHVIKNHSFKEEDVNYVLNPTILEI